MPGDSSDEDGGCLFRFYDAEKKCIRMGAGFSLTYGILYVSLAFGPKVDYSMEESLRVLDISTLHGLAALWGMNGDSVGRNSESTEGRRRKRRQRQQTLSKDRINMSHTRPTITSAVGILSENSLLNTSKDHCVFDPLHF